jgi:hypothetical protein
VRKNGGPDVVPEDETGDGGEEGDEDRGDKGWVQGRAGDEWHGEKAEGEVADADAERRQIGLLHMQVRGEAERKEESACYGKAEGENDALWVTNTGVA